MTINKTIGKVILILVKNQLKSKILKIARVNTLIFNQTFNQLKIRIKKVKKIKLMELKQIILNTIFLKIKIIYLLLRFNIFKIYLIILIILEIISNISIINLSFIHLKCKDINITPINFSIQIKILLIR